MSRTLPRPSSPPSGRAATALALLAILRLVLHAVAWPVWEGPDEPFHQARAEAWAARPLGPGPAEALVPAALVSAFSARPCGESMARAFGCPPFDGGGALFNAFRSAPPADANACPNYEAHQPPLWYLLAGWLLRPAISLGASPEARLLLLRLASVLAIALALVGPLRRLAERRGPVLLAGIAAVLLLPAGGESFARASNDALVFLLVAEVVERLDRDDPGPSLPLLLAAGPLVKLTFLPVAAFAVLELARRRAWRAALLSAVASALVVPAQALRGWAWGGTYELNRTAGALGESAAASVLGFGRSLYTFAKTTFWIGGWSFFRAPFALVASFFVLLLLAAVLVRPASPARRLLPHLAALGVAAAGFTVLAVGNRRLFGAWGGLGGWYAWNWLPWLAVAADDLLERRSDGARRLLVGAFAAFLAVAAAAFAAAAARLYG